ncbi:CDP-diacylglycerol--serine O-phosphatidyltransferase [Cecembia calidifontis]|jgi:CDP-diacylglycerol--serine O-phosphatidyltransferase|uniref:CDP-diacylglycerol--serine O-phosphatidyltransferase n=2 Tax=Cecembia calidifontis TaxID=1187080 RepID=A0A4Q7PD68_9BACT|nr:CDP-diacylglycerol--serine O-phosphatidyltransferase [Cecembia calidifontis]
MIKKQIPNTLTCLNLLSGMLGIYFVLEGNIKFGAYFIFVAALFDFLDGFLARILKVHSEIGKELDSLADLVTFGVLPSFVLFQMINQNGDLGYLPFFVFIVGIFSAIRLAKFNVDTRQSDRFIGVPTPANALLISTLPFLAERFPGISQTLNQPHFIMVLALVLSFLLVSELPLIALKFKNFGIKDNIFRYLTILIGIICVFTLGIGGIPFVIISYIVLSVIEGLFTRNAKAN